MARSGHRNRERKNTHTRMAKVVWAKPTEDGNYGFNTKFVKLDDVEDTLEELKKKQNRERTE